jgi:3-hydroxyacyl-[acyl-carrier protein] dehydratase/trans-2-decenoyl-[acyl-carrier protein] isomerase
MVKKFISKKEIEEISLGESLYHKNHIERGTDFRWTCKLPHGHMKMIDRAWYNFDKGTGKYGNGYLRAEKDISQEDWYFYCHFLGDPIMPGCLGLDGCLQCIALALILLGFPGRGRALAGNFEFNGSVITNIKKIAYHMDIKRIFKKPFPLIIADIDQFKDGRKEPIIKVRDGRLGLLEKGQTEHSPHFLPNWEKIKRDALRDIEESRKYYIKHFGGEGY